MKKALASMGGSILWNALKNHEQILTLPEECRPASIEDGYAIQDCFIIESKSKVRGYKVGATNAKVQERFGVTSPFFGRLLEPFLYNGSPKIPSNTVNFFAIEAEFDFIIGQDLSPRSTPYTDKEIRDAVESIHPAIEVPDSRYKNWLSVEAPELIADNAIAGVLVLGEKSLLPIDTDLVSATVEIRVNGQPVSSGLGANVLGGPWNVLVWLVHHLNSRGLSLEAGHIVTTGSAAEVIHCQSGDFVECDFGNLGLVSLSFG